MNRTPSVNLIWITLGNGYIILFSSVFIVLSIYCFVIAYPTNNFLITFTKLQLGVCLLLIIEKVINSYCIIKYVNARYYLFSLKKFKKRYYISFIALENINNIILFLIIHY